MCDCADSASGSKSGGDDDTESDREPADTQQLAAETQRILRGKNYAAIFKPLHKPEWERDAWRYLTYRATPCRKETDDIFSRQHWDGTAADAARSDRIGKGAAPAIQPLSGVLAKILQRKEEAISRWRPQSLPLGFLRLTHRNAWLSPAWYILSIRSSLQD